MLKCACILCVPTSQKLSELPRSLRSPLEDILGSALQHGMMAATGKTAERHKRENSIYYMQQVSGENLQHTSFSQAKKSALVLIDNHMNLY